MKLVQVVGFVTKKFVTMHGQMNVKKNNVTTQRFIHAYSLNNVQKQCTLYVHTIYANGVYRLIHVVSYLIGIQITC